MSPYHRRLRELERSGTIRGYRAVVDADALGLAFEALDSLGLLATGDIGPLSGQTRAAEAGDPEGTRWPRAKRHDDAAVVRFS